MLKYKLQSHVYLSAQQPCGPSLAYFNFAQHEMLGASAARNLERSAHFYIASNQQDPVPCKVQMVEWYTHSWISVPNL